MNVPGDNESLWLLSNELKPGEKLLWCGKPPGGIRFRAGDILLIPFSLAWGGFALFWEGSVLTIAIRKGAGQGFAPWGMVLFGIPFVVVGLYLLVGRFVFDWRDRMLTHYGLTDQRVLLLHGQNLTAIALKGLADVRVFERIGGRGDIFFGRPQTVSHRRTGLAEKLDLKPKLAFEGIADAGGVHRQVEEAIAAMS